jgi:hypothetical protein
MGFAGEGEKISRVKISKIYACLGRNIGVDFQIENIVKFFEVVRKNLDQIFVDNFPFFHGSTMELNNKVRKGATKTRNAIPGS